MGKIVRARLPSSLGKKHPHWNAYRGHRKRATSRGILFLLTFKEWLTIWRESGHLHECGNRRGQYVMARYGDKGPYAVGNVRICTTDENREEWNSDLEKRSRANKKIRESHTGKKHTPETKEKNRQAHLGRKPTTEARENMRRAWERRRIEKPMTPETKEKIREFRLGKKNSPESKEKISVSLKIAWAKRKELDV